MDANRFLSYEYVIATIDEDFHDIAAVDSYEVPNPYSIPLPAQSGVFTLVRTPVDPIAQGHSQDTVDLLLGLCDYLFVSDIFVSRIRAIDENRTSLIQVVQDLSHKYQLAEAQAVSLGAYSLSAIAQDHVFQALLITINLQFPEVISVSYIGCLSHTEKLRRLQYHIRQSPKHDYWTPIPGALIWCLMVAISASKGLPIKEFFVANMMRATIGVAFELIEPVRFALATFYRLGQQQKHKAKIDITVNNHPSFNVGGNS